ncbi:MAG: primosomal protein N' [Firmicutes bacterium]|nr:primosomal protein N' [Bacillota bacterium]
MAEAPSYVSVAVDVAVARTDRPFDYAVPTELRGRVAPGQRVLVPLGGRRVEGIVLRGLDEPSVDPEKVRPILRAIDEEPLLTQELLDLAPWLAEQCGSTLVQVLRAMLPGGVKNRTEGPREREVLWPAAGDAPPAALGRAPAQARAYRVLAENPGRWTRLELARAAAVAPAVVAALLRRGLALAVPEGAAPGGAAGGAAEAAAARGGEGRARAAAASSAAPAAVRPGAPARPAVPEPTPDQAAALAAILPAVAAGRHEIFLLHGVTGSGKTEVYLRAIEACLAAGREAVVLVPEIALTPQTVARFRERFGDDVAVLHSGLTLGERRRQWRRIMRGEVRVAVGARSAVFAPFRRPGLFIVDEEHETTYKQDEAPRYHARQVAVERARRLGVPVVLGSATPSLESYVAALNGRGRLLPLPRRVEGRPLPHVEVIDMRREREAGNRSLFSEPLAEAIRGALARGEQVLLFLNRRGFAPVVLCRDCGRTVECPSCSVTLTYHRQTGLLHCHYCDHRAQPPAVCPHCASPNVKYYGIGTQRVEELAREHFPGARVLRMDVDTTGTRGAHERIYRAFQAGEADILVGTQMVAKGWDVAGVTVVGVVHADTGLHLPDFRAAERTFQLITQVAGRAGRGERPGRVFVQTYAPDHYAIRAAARQDCLAFWEAEVPIRRAGPWPPFCELVRIVVSGPEGAGVDERARALGVVLRRSAVRVLGPAPAPIERLRGRVRWHLVLTGDERLRLLRAVREALDVVRLEDPLAAHVDPDPVSML